MTGVVLEEFKSYIIAEKNTIASKSKIIQLANLGIEVNENNAKELITYLSDVMELNNIEPKISVGHLGWIDKEFVPYSNKYCLDIDKEFKQKINSISEHGNYEKWKDYIKQLRQNSLTLRFMIASSFASVLVRIFKLNTFIVHLWGKSGNGKTVAEMICASIWGKPDNNFISNLSNTSIANERLCNFYKNMPILLDELQIAKAKYKNFDELIYVLTEGKGKERGTVDSGIREQTTWQTIVILNGEEPITSDTSKEGVKNRVIEINEDNMIVKDGNATVKFIQDNYGFAGKEFIKLIENREELQKIQQYFVKELNAITEYKKQINAFSIIMTADYIVSKKIFKTRDTKWKIADLNTCIDEKENKIYQEIIGWYESQSENLLGISHSYDVPFYSLEALQASLKRCKEEIHISEQAIPKLKESIKEAKAEMERQRQSYENKKIEIVQQIRALGGEKYKETDIPNNGIDDTYRNLNQIANAQSYVYQKDVVDRVQQEAQNQADIKEAELRGLTIEQLLQMRKQAKAMDDESIIEANEESVSHSI